MWNIVRLKKEYLTSQSEKEKKNEQSASHFTILNNLNLGDAFTCWPRILELDRTGFDASSALDCLCDVGQGMSLSSNFSSAKLRSSDPHHVFVRIFTLHKISMGLGTQKVFNEQELLPLL